MAMGVGMLWEHQTSSIYHAFTAAPVVAPDETCRYLVPPVRLHRVWCGLSCVRFSKR